MTPRWFPILLWGLLLPASVAVAVDEMHIGVLARHGAAEAEHTWSATAGYLSERIPGYRFRVVPMRLDEIAAAVESGHLDFLLVNPSVYVELESRFAARALATLRNRPAGRASTRFGGVIFIRADRAGVAGLADLRNLPFMAVDEYSLGGFHAAWRELKHAGIDPYRDFSLLRFGATHEAVVQAVRDGTVAAGTVRTDTLERMAAAGEITLKDFRILHPVRHAGFPFLCSTGLYPEWAFAKLRHIPDELARRVASVLIAMSPQNEPALRSQSAGWTEPADYGPVHELARELGIGPARAPAAVQRVTLGEATGFLLVVLALGGAVLYGALVSRRLRRSEAARADAEERLATRIAKSDAALNATRAELEASLHRERLVQRDWHDAFDAISDPIFIHDREGRIVSANPSYFARAGMTAEQAVGKFYWQVFPRLSEPMLSCREFQASGVTVGTSELQLDNGEVLVSRSFGIRAGESEMRHAIHILEDVTVERHAAAEWRMLSHAIEQAGEGVLITDLMRRIRYANAAFARLINTVPEALRDRRLPELFDTASQTLLEAAFAQITRETWSGELLLDHGSRDVPVFVTASALLGDAGHSGYVFTLMDLRTVKAAEQALKYRLGFESAVGAIAARFVAVDVATVDVELIAALGRVGSLVGADRACMFRHEAALSVMKKTHQWCASDPADCAYMDTIALPELPWVTARLAGLGEVHIADVEALPAEAAPDQAFFRRCGIRSLLAVPLTLGERLVGMLAFDVSHQAKTWAEADIRLLRAVGEIVANTLSRLEAEAEVLRSRESLSQAQRIAQLGNWEWQIAANRLTCSDEVCRIFEIPLEMFPSTYEAFLERVHQDDRPLLQDEVNKSLRGEQDLDLEHRVIMADGGVKIVHMNALVIRDAAGAPERMVGTLQDVTAARTAERELRRLNRALRTLSRGNETLVRAGDEHRLLEDICRVLVDVGGYRFAWVGYPDTGAERLVLPQAWAGREAGYLSAVRIGWGDDALGQGPVGIAQRTGEPFIVADLATAPCFALWCEEALKRGYAALIALPLKYEQEQLGVLSIKSAERNAFDQVEVSLLRELADDLAFGIVTLRNKRLREQTEEELALSERRYHGLYDNAPMAYMSVNHDGAITQANAAMVRLLGFEHAELIGRNVFDCYTEGADGLDKARAIFERCRTGEAVRDQELRMRRKDGQPIWASISAEPVPDESGGVGEIRSGVLDISARKQGEEERRRMGERLRQALVQTIQAVAVTIEKRDPYTAGHQMRVAALAVAIGRELGMAGERLEGLLLGAQIHDIGKIYVPAEFLNRPGRLTETEFDIIRTHPHMGYDVIKGIDFPWPVAEMIMQHHERLDGSGYPRGLKGDEIILEARIIAVADVVESMASHRPYRPALPLSQALTEIESYKGKRYDEAAVDACLRLFREEGFSWIGDGRIPQAQRLA